MNLLDRRSARDAALLVVDVQEKLMALMEDRARVVGNSVRLIRAAALLGIPTWATEQYPKGLGPTVSEIAALISQRSEKLTFSCCGVPELVEQLHGRGIRHVTVAGIEAHVCVAQTALDLLRLGFGVGVPADAVGSRNRLDWELALRRLERAGAVVTSTEAMLFEWLGTADHPQFKAISALVKEAVVSG
jgi:nicotinamidase-related amidase